MENGLNALSGKDIRTAFNVLGYPSGKQEFGSNTVYFWSGSRVGEMYLPQTSTTYGTIGTTPFYGTTTSGQIVPVNYSCLIKLITNQNGMIISWEYEGNIGGCAYYIQNLNRYYESQQ